MPPVYCSNSTFSGIRQLALAPATAGCHCERAIDTMLVLNYWSGHAFDLGYLHFIQLIVKCRILVQCVPRPEWRYGTQCQLSRSNPDQRGIRRLALYAVDNMSVQNI